MKRKLILSALCLTALIAVLAWTQTPVRVAADAPTEGICPPIGDCEAFQGQRFTICHIAGHVEDDNANEVELTIPCTGVRGHFDIQGNPLAGHENDRCGACEEKPPCVPDPKTGVCP